MSSAVRAAAVTCAIMNPELSPESLVKNAGRPLSCGVIMRSVRRSLMVASWARPIASVSAARAIGAP